MPRISVVIPLFNVSPEQVRECLENVTEVFDGDEIILSDNSVHHDAALVVEDFRRSHSRGSARIGYFHHAALVEVGRRSRALALNVAGRLATGKILLFLHSDVRVPPGARAGILDALADEAIVAGGFRKRYALSPSPPLLTLAEDLLNARARTRKHMVGTNGMFIRREVFLARPFEDSFLEDFEYSDWLRARFGPERIAFIDSIGVDVGAGRYQADGITTRLLINLVVMAAYRLRRLPTNQLWSLYNQAGKLPLAKLLRQSIALLLSSKVKSPTLGVEHPRAAAVVFVKSPEAGKVKTRLFRNADLSRAPQVTAEGACEIYRAFLDDLLDRLGCVPTQDVEFFVSPSFQEVEGFRNASHSLLPCYPKTLREDLGRSMGETIRHFLASGYPAAMILNSDAPHLELTLIERAARALRSADVVLGPDHRGGCYLIGMAHPDAAAILDGVQWSAGTDFGVLSERARCAGWRLETLPEQYDVDEPEDLQRLAADLHEGRIDRSILKRTAIVLRSIISGKAAAQ